MRKRECELTGNGLKVMIISMSLKRLSNLLLTILVLIPWFGGSSLPPGDQTERVRAYTRQIEFNYITWTAGAIGVKLGQLAIGVTNYLPEAARRQVVLDFLQVARQIQQGEAELNEIYANPEVTDPDSASAELRQHLLDLYARRAQLSPIAESILQTQISQVVAELGLALSGQPIPPILFHSTPLPLALVISPRDKIEQQVQISLVSDLTLDQQVALEDRVDQALDVSSLVVEVGGIGMYPTMVMETDDLNWLSEVVAHEWIHNYLTLRPLGLNYMTSPELRTMNETAASIAGKEIGRQLVARYYPELLPPPAPPQPSQEAGQGEPPAFDFRAQMRETRLTVDELLALGDVEGAEKYMELRRIYFWENGYHIRKLNQAYFAFYGAYADEPGGASGEDPVGQAVRDLRAHSPSLADFIKRISWMTSYDQLRRAVGQSAHPSGN